MKIRGILLAVLGLVALVSPGPALGQGLLPPAEQEKTFHMLDKNQDGKLTQEEFAAIWRNPQVAAREFKKLDGNGDGVVTREEFTRTGGLGGPPPPAKP